MKKKQAKKSLFLKIIGTVLVSCGALAISFVMAIAFAIAMSSGSSVNDDAQPTELSSLECWDIRPGREPFWLSTDSSVDDGCTLMANTYYELTFRFPDEVKASFKDGTADYNITVEYDTEVETGETGHIQLRMTGVTDESIYVAQGYFIANGNLSLEHVVTTNAVTGKEMNTSFFANDIPISTTITLATFEQESYEEQSRFTEELDDGTIHWNIRGITEQEKGHAMRA